MILIADSGSTKCAWRWIGQQGSIFGLTTPGINPFFRTTDQIYNELAQELLPATGDQIQKIYFYGAGIINAEKGAIVGEALRRLYPAASVETYSDVVGAARALFGNEAGIAAILGTGSNACLYDGHDIAASIPPMGFILGDEGSGAVMGRKLIGDFFKLRMPEHLRKKFEEEFRITKEEVLQRVYRTEKPNEYLAGFIPFLSAHIGEPYAEELILGSFIEFFDRNIIQLPSYKSYRIGFVGSVAFYFQPFLHFLCKKHEMECVPVLREPIDGLSQYHFQKP